MKRITLWGYLVGIFVLTATPLFAAQDNLMDKSLEDLLSMPVTSLSGREQKKNEVAGAMTVITKEDIRKSGVHNIPDLFYRVPGMQVRKIDAHRYYVSIRSYGSLYQGSLLVLVDGVVVFNPVQSGTNWELLPVSLNEIERIEIIRGPGGVLYSSNAAKGVINIITKKATEKDNYAAVRAGSQNLFQQQMGMGEKVNDNLSIRGYVEHSHDTGFNHKINDVDVSDPTSSEIAGLKAQYDWSEDINLVLDGKFLDQTGITDVPNLDTVKRPGFQDTFSARFQQKVNDAYDYNIHVDHMAISTSVLTSLDSTAHAYTLKSQHNLKYNFYGDHLTSFGLEARWIKIDYEYGFLPPADPYQTQKIDSIFLQDEYRPTDKLILTAGLRATKNTVVVPDASPFYEPRVSAVYLLNDLHSLRATVTRTVRTPSMYDQDINYLISTAYNWYARGTEMLDAEKSLTYELGWQGLMLDKKLTMNTTIFYTDMNDPIIPTFEYPVSHMVNNGSVQSVGLEWDSSYKFTDNLSVKADYTYINADPRPNFPLSGNYYIRAQSLNMSKHQAGLGFEYVKNAVTLDVYAKWISKYTDTGEGAGKIPSYWKTTLRAAYAFKMPGMKMKDRDAEVELVANDLFDAHTVESPHGYVREPDVYAGLKVRF